MCEIYGIHPRDCEQNQILKADFHNLNLVFHNKILVSGFCDRFHSNQHVRIMFPPNFGDLGMSKKITPFFLPKCPLGHAGSWGASYIYIHHNLGIFLNFEWPRRRVWFDVPQNSSRLSIWAFYTLLGLPDEFSILGSAHHQIGPCLKPGKWKETKIPPVENTFLAHKYAFGSPSSAELYLVKCFRLDNATNKISKFPKTHTTREFISWRYRVALK